MNNDGIISIATGYSAGSLVWKNKKMLFSEFAAKIADNVKPGETYAEYINAPKEEQSKIKDVGGYVSGYLRGGRRGIKNIVHKQMLTLDVDFAHVDFWEDFTMQFGNAAVIHSTHKHCEASPRYRLLIPLNREATPDEYCAVARQIAGTLGIELFDNTTFEINRLMFWSSTSKDKELYYRMQDGPWVNVDEILATYYDWKDTSLWPTADRKLREIADASKKQEDPENKKGIVGAWCRTYSVSEAIELFLSDVYVPATEGRYTYTKGTTAAGLLLYDDKFAFSHHGTDPCGGKLCNAFDLVRIHKFGHLDTTDDGGIKSKSYQMMEDLAREDKRVKTIIASENIASAKYDFGEADENETVDIKEEDLLWMAELEADRQGNYLSTANNIDTILANDVRLKDAFKLNDFDGKRYVFTSLPWRKVKKPEPVKNVDYSGVRNYIESIYGIAGTLKIDDSLAIKFEKHSFHPIKDYLSGLVWDGESRINNLLIDYFGADNNIYTQEAIRKWLCGGVARVFKPGCKFDLVLTIVGEQGTKKSTFLAKLGKQWFSDTFMTVQGKEALEQIQGAWLIEIAELAGFRKAEVEAVKHFISKQEDTFRPAYGRTAETYYRQCIFAGTTNNKDFLRDPTGNRRFMPIDVVPSRIIKDVFFDLDPKIDQIWAEAVHLFRKGEQLYLSPEAEQIARLEQLKHSEVDERKGLIEQYLNRLLPKDWDVKDIYERRSFLDDPLGIGTISRDYVCIAEIWCECLGKDKENMSRYNTKDLNEIMRGLPEWEPMKSTRNFKIYGAQRHYAKSLI